MRWDSSAGYGPAARSDMLVAGNNRASHVTGVSKMSEVDRQDTFAALFRGCYRQVLAYVHILVSNFTDAEDVVQQTSLVLWRKFDEYEPGTSFVAWACGIARFEALNFLKRKRRYQNRFSEAFQLKLAEAVSGVAAAEVDRRMTALEDCVEMLPENQRDLLRMCFGESQSVADVARRLGRTTHSVYSSLRNIRHKLFNCVEQATSRSEK
ncbi:MAG: sigma-70 family RNA polymerase sigma factor [Pirellulales bacterium]|nr:sigma-70 family RNA polymerase sigma factor [Pirellulales bacterium]